MPVFAPPNPNYGISPAKAREKVRVCKCFGCALFLLQRHAFLLIVHLTAGVPGHLERQNVDFQHVIDTPFARKTVILASCTCNSNEMH